jgi:hypothetical protein
VIYIDHFEMLLLIFQIFHWSGQGRPYLFWKPKISKQFYPTSAIASSDKYPIKSYEGKN